MLLPKRAFGLFVSFISFALFSTYCDAKKPDVKSKVAKTTISGYVQAQFRATNEDDAEPSNTFTIGRSRLQLDADLTDSLSTMFEISANTEKVEAEDLYLRYKISPQLSLKVGQIKKPFSYAQLEAARKSAIINRPLCVEEYFNRYLGRDIGLIVRLEPHKRVDFKIGVFNGTGVGNNELIDDNNAKDFVGRLELNWVGKSGFSEGKGRQPKKWLEMAFNASSHAFTECFTIDKRVSAYGADLSIARGGFSAVIEGLIGNKPQIEIDTRMLSLYATFLYKREFKNHAIVAVESGGRVEYADDDTDDDDAIVSITPCINLYFYKNARLQFCPNVRIPEQGDTIIEFATQVQIEF